MKTTRETDELRPEYDFSQMPGGVRGKYAAAYRGGANLGRRDPDGAAGGDRKWLSSVRARIGEEILQGLREIKRGEVGRVVTYPPVAETRARVGVAQRHLPG
jgi:hypothetical protein